MNSSNPFSPSGEMPGFLPDPENTVFLTEENTSGLTPPNSLSLATPDTLDPLPLTIDAQTEWENQNSAQVTLGHPLAQATSSQSDIDSLTGIALEDAWVSGEDGTNLSQNEALPVNATNPVPVSGDVFVVPGSKQESVKLRFLWTLSEAKFRSEIGIFALDEQGRVNGVAPGEAGFAYAALTSSTRQVVFSSGEWVGAWNELTFQGGDRLAFYLIQNSTTAHWLSSNSGNTGNGPVAFFSVDGVNSDGVDHARSWSYGPGLQLFAWEDLWGGGDHDFNDVVFWVCEVGLQIPGELGQFAPLTVQWLGKEARFKNEMGFFLVDDAEGRLGNLKPGDSGYAAAALSKDRSKVLFASGYSSDSELINSLPSGKYLGWYLIQDATTEQFLLQNSKNEIGKGPLAFFSYPGANPDGLSHVHYRNGNEMIWEDQTSGGDRDYDDLVFRFNLGTPTGNLPGGDLPTLSINDIQLQEGDFGLGEAIFTVSLSEVSDKTVTVDFETIEGTAKAGLDFQALKGKLAFAPGERTKALVVPFIGDLLEEEDENFLIRLTNANNALIFRNQGIATIKDNEQTIGVLLKEEANFRVVYEKSLVIPDEPSVLSFAFADLNFDLTDSASINDAFEAALVDANGNSLVHTILGSRDAFFNLTEGEVPALATGVSLADQTVSINLAGVVPGTEAKLIVRLVNNDGDTETSVKISNVSVAAADVEPPSGVVSLDSLAASRGSAPDFSRLSDVSSSVLAEYGRTSFNEDTDILYADLKLRNAGQYSISAPLVIAVKNLSDPAVQVVGADGTTPEGLPYFNFTNLLNQGLKPTEVTSNRALTFYNPQGMQFTYTLVVLGELNTKPVILSTPDLEIIGGQTYSYDVNATDPNGDTLNYSLVVAPSGMTINSQTGLISWETKQTDVANHAIKVRVSDGRGGVEEQTYTLSVIAEPPNRPPIFVSTPIVDAQINQPYQYDADATDPDQDPLQYSLVSGPVGMTVDPNTGLVQWTPPPALSLGDTVFGRISLPGDQSEFTFSGVIGQRLYLDRLQEFSGLNIAIYSPSNKEVSQGNGLFTLTETGNYRVVVSGSGDRTGSYGFSLIAPALLPETPLDRVIEGQLSPGTDDDLFRFNGIAGQKIFFDKLSNNGTLDWVLFDPSNQIIVQESSMNDMEVNLPSDGEYILALRGNGDFGRITNYSFSIVTPEVTTLPIGFNTLVSGNLTEKGEQDHFTFTRKAGQQLWYDALGSDSLVLRLYDPFGKEVDVLDNNTRSDVGENFLRLSMEGTYKLVIDGTGEAIGNYSFRLLDRAAAPIVALDTDIAGTLDNPLGTTLYRFNLAEKQYLYIDALEGNGNWGLYGPDGRFISWNGLNTDREFTLDAGEYLLAIHGTGSSPNYKIRLITSEITTTPIQVGSTITGSLTEKGEQDHFTFTGKAGQQLWYDGLGSDSLVLKLYDPFGKEVYLYNNNSRYDVGVDYFRLSMEGTYKLVIDGTEEAIGNYSFRLLDRATAPIVALDTDIVGTLDNPLGTTLYRFNLAEKQYLYIDALEGNGNWGLYGPDGRFISWNGLSSDQEFSLDAGEYLLAIHGTGSSSNYKIRLITSEITTTPIQVGSTITGSLTEKGEQDHFTFTGKAGQQLWYDALGGDSLVLKLYDPFGKEVYLYNNDSRSDNPVDYLRLSMDGTYNLVIDGAGEAVGDYSFRLLDRATAPIVALDTDITGTLDNPLGTTLYRFNLTDNRSIFIDGKEGNGTWLIYGSDGRFINLGSLTQDKVLQLQNGEYLLVLQGNGSSANYKLKLEAQEIFNPPSFNDTPLSLGEVANGTISQTSEQKGYTFIGKAGQQLFYDALGGAKLGVSLYDPTGRAIYSGISTYWTGTRSVTTDSRNDRGPDIGLMLSMDGTYRIAIDGTSEGVGNYSFRLLDRANAPIVALDNDITGTLDNPAGSTLYRFNLTEKQYLYVDGLEGDGNWIIYGPDGRYINSARLFEDREFELNAGEYLLVMQGSGSNPNYKLRLITPELTTTTPIQVGQAISGTISEKGEQDSFTFTGKAGQQLFYDALSSDSLGISLYDPTGKPVYSGVGWWGGIYINSRDDRGLDNGLTLSMDGTYRITIDGDVEGVGNYSFRLLNRANAPVITLDSDIAATLDNPAGSTLYRFNLTEKQYLYVDGLEGDGNWIIYGPDGRYVNSARLYEDREFELNAGEYLLVMQGSGSNPNYKLRLITPELTTTPIQVGQTINGTISEKGEQDSFTFTGKAGQQLFYDALSSDSFGISLYDPTGKVVYSGLFLSGGIVTDSRNDRGPDNGLTLSMDGTYRITIDGDFEGIGNYSFRLLDRANAPFITLDSDITVTLDNPAGSTLYRFNLAEKQYLYVDGLEGNGNWIIYGPDGRYINSARLYEDREFELNADEYLLVMQGSGSNPNYKLRLITPELTTTPIQVGQTINGSISEKGEQDSFTFTGKAGQQLFYDALSSDSFGISLYDPTGKPVYSGVGWWGGIYINSRDDRGLDNGLTLSMDGIYRITIDGAFEGTGNYSFRLLDKAMAPILKFNEDVSGIFDNNALGSATYQINLASRQYIYFDIQEGQGDWKLYGSGGQLVRSGGLYQGDSEFWLDEGEYLLVMQGVGGTSNYKLQFATPQLNTTPLSLGTLTSGTIASRGEQDTYTFMGTVGQRVFFDALTGNPNLKAQLYSPSNRLVKRLDSNIDSLPLTLTEAGIYRFVIDGENTSTGDYSFILSDVGQVTSLNPSTSVIGSLEHGNSANLYRFNSTQGSTLQFDLTAEQWSGANWILYEPGNKAIATPNSSSPDFRVTLPSNGQYILAVLGNSNSPTAYEFKVTNITDTPVQKSGLNVLFSGSQDLGAVTQFLVTATAGTRVLFDGMTTSGNAARVRLINPDGTVAFTEFTNANSAPITLQQTGNYTLQVDPGSGSYSFKLLEMPQSLRSPGLNYLELGGIVSGALAGGESKIYTFEGLTGLPIYFNGIGLNNSLVSLYAPNNVEIFSGLYGFYNSSTYDLGPYTLPQDGIYHLVISNAGATEQNYTFQALELLTGSEIDFNLPVSGTLKTGQETTFYKLNSKAGQTLFFDSLQGTSANSWLLLGPDLTLLKSSRLDQDFQVDITTTGEYTLLIQGGTSLDPVTYQFRVLERNPNVADVLIPGIGQSTRGEGKLAAEFAVKLKVNDGQGGSAIQDYTIRVGPDPQNANPLITSVPETRFSLKSEVYRYQVKALDPDQDPLRYRLIDAPLGALIDNETGEILWFPESGVVPGSKANFTVEVSDRRGGFDRQTFTVDVFSDLGTIRGDVFDDINGNGVQDTKLFKGENPSLVLALDVSGSTIAPFKGNRQYPNVKTVLDAEVAASLALIESLISQGLGNTIKIGLIPHRGVAVLQDMDPATPGLQAFTTPLADNDNNGIADIREILQSYKPDGSNNFTQTIETIRELVQVLPGSPNVIFMSDGYDTSFQRDPARGLQVIEELRASGINLNAFAIGEASTLETIQRIDSDAERVVEIRKLVDIFSGKDPNYILEPYNNGVTVYLDLNNNGVLDGNEPLQISQFEQRTTRIEDSSYQFNFDNLLPGTYTLRQIIPASFTQTAPNIDPIVSIVTIAGESFTYLFGLHKNDTTPPNSDPKFLTTIEATDLQAGNGFIYRAKATDPDADPITYSLALNPEGMTVDSATGVVVWIPTPKQVENYYQELKEIQQRLNDIGRGDSAPKVVEFNVLLRANDGRGGQALQAIPLKLLPPNAAPTFTSDPTKAGSPQISKPFQYKAIAIDPDGDPITYELGTSAPNGVALDSTTGILTWTSTDAQWGNQTISLKAKDGKGGESTQVLNLTVIQPQPNTNPTITSIPRLTTRTGAPYLYQMEVNDPDGDVLSFALTKAPSGMTIDSSGRLVWQPNAAQVGSNEITITVNDSQGGSDTQTYTLNVSNQAGNFAPVITSEPPYVTNIQRGYQYRAKANDPDGDALIWQLENAPQGMVIDAQTGVVSWQPLPNQVGKHIVTVAVTDILGAQVSQTYTLEVRGINTPAQFTSVPPTQIGLGQPYTYTLKAVDPEGDSVRYGLGTHPEGMTLNEATGQLQWTPQSTQVGNHTIEVLAQDTQGGVARQTYTLVVSRDAVNRSPSITSNPSFWADPTTGYQYQITATDPDGDSLTYSILNGPTGLQVNPTTGLVQWTPTTAQIGSQKVTVAAFDALGLGSTQTYTINVTATNQAPVIRSTPKLTVATDATYRYDVWASDPDGEPITYAMAKAPTGMKIDDQGRISWKPGVTDIGTHPIEITVTDSRGAITRQPYKLVVQTDQEAPKVSLTANPPQVNVGGTVTLKASAADNVGVKFLSLTVNGQAVAIHSQGLATLKLGTTGRVEAVATAVDAAGNVGKALLDIFVADPTDVEAPKVNLVSLEGNKPFTTPITSFTDIIGTVTDDNLVEYTLSIAPVSGGSFTSIAKGTGSVTNGILGTFDPSTLQNDSYFLRLEAVDAGGLRAYNELIVEVAGELKLGNFRVSFTDLSIPVSGIPIQVTRTYDTLTSNTRDDFGYGWRMEFRDTDLRTSLGPDPELLELGVPSKGFSAGDRVYITLPGGKREAFTFKPRLNPINRFLPSLFGNSPLYTPAFEADPGVTSTLTVQKVDLIQLDNGEFASLNGGRYNPANGLYGFGGYYSLTTKEGITYRINGLNGDLETITDRNNNVLTFTDSSITSSTGKTVTFKRDAQGRITEVIDPEGKSVRYTYDALGDLVAVTDREGNTTKYDYNDQRTHYLESIIDPLNRTGVRTEYDEQGRMKRMIDADGNPIELVYDPDSDLQQVRDQYGNLTTYVYDQRGNVLSERNAEGEVTERTYDGDNNVETETIILKDGTRLTTTFTYNANGDVLTETDPQGKVTRYTYDNYGNVLTTTDPTGQTVTNTYDNRGNLTKIAGQASGTMTFEYDAAGNLKEMNDGAGATIFEYDLTGNLIKQTDANGKITTYTYDKNGNRKTETTNFTLLDGTSRTLLTQMEYDNEGRVIKAIDAEGGVTETRYDKVGNRVWEKNARGYITEYRYDDRGQLIETIYPDETPATKADNPRTIDLYDIGGRLRASIDEEGFATHFVYDKAGRRVATIYPKDDNTLAQLIATIAPGQTPATIDWTQVVYPNETPAFLATNPRTRTEYDAAGRVVAEIDERENRTEFRYDKAGRLLETILPDDTPQDLTDNPRISSTYDDAGRQLTQTDALSQTTRFLYDNLGRPEGQESVNSSRTRVEYDTAGRVYARIDQEGKKTQYEYDSLGRLKAVIDAKGKRTKYTYDPQGNLIEQEDAEGRVTKYEYDKLGRRKATVLPLGQSSTSEYDPIGNLKSTTDFNGKEIEYIYDARNRLTFKDLPGTEFDVTYTYTLDGQLRTVTDARGTTNYRYDAQNRLLERIDPDGTTIAYSYDIAGNRTSIEIPSGTTAYTFDAQNRLKAVSDPEGGVTTYTYNPVGNLVRTNFPNGTAEIREYDTLNRLVFIKTSGPGGVIASFRYTLDETGNRTAVEEHDGRRVKYEYDDLYRLTAEIIYDPGAVGPSRIIEYTYDAVGNRLSRTDTGEGTTVYTYDKNDRLLTATTNGVGTIYTYDNNGNTASKTTDGTTVTYTWNADNRLIGADTNGDGIIDVINRYNHNGIRVNQTASGAETRFLIDENRDYAQVLEEYTSSGVIKVSYIHGNDLIYQHREVEKSYYQVDGLGSIRALSNKDGANTDQYLYDAFGQIIKQVGDTENSYLFAGEQRDSNIGLDYLRARYLSTEVGRFYGRDAFEGFLDNPLTLNKHIYVNANPLTHIDPSGNMTLGEVGMSILAAGILYAGYKGFGAYTNSRSALSNLLSSQDDNVRERYSLNLTKWVVRRAIPLFGSIPQNYHYGIVAVDSQSPSNYILWDTTGRNNQLIALYPETLSVEALRNRGYQLENEILTLSDIEYNVWSRWVALNSAPTPYSLQSNTCQNQASRIINAAKEIDKNWIKYISGGVIPEFNSCGAF